MTDTVIKSNTSMYALYDILRVGLTMHSGFLKGEEKSWEGLLEKYHISWNSGS